jgi:hypothetical protein
MLPETEAVMEAIYQAIVETENNAAEATQPQAGGEG